MGACICLLSLGIVPLKPLMRTCCSIFLSTAATGKVARDLTGKTKGGIINGGAKIVPGLRGKALELDGGSGYLQIELTPEMIEAERNSFTAELMAQK